MSMTGAHKSLAHRRLRRVRDQGKFVLCPFRCGTTQTITIFNMFVQSCKHHREIEKARQAHKQPLIYGCLECPLSDKDPKDIELEDIPPWIVIADDTPEKRAVFEQLKDNAISQLQYASLLMAYARVKNENSMEEVIAEKEKELKEKEVPVDLETEARLLRRERQLAKREKGRPQRKLLDEKSYSADELPLVNYIPKGVSREEEIAIWKDFREFTLDLRDMEKKWNMSRKKIWRIVNKYDVINRVKPELIKGGDE